MIKAITVLLCVFSTSALRPGQKASPALLKKAAPELIISSTSATSTLRPGQKGAASAPAKSAPTPIKKAAASLPVPTSTLRPGQKGAVSAPAKSAPVPIKKAAASLPVPTSALRPGQKGAVSAPAKSAPAPVKSAPASIKKAAAPASKLFTPKSFQASSSFAYGLVGSDVEAGEFDPLELSKGRSPETIAWYRAAELKHGRICMLAALGLFVSPFAHLPDEVFSSKAGLGALAQIYNERPEAIWQILVTLGAIEVSSLFSNGQGTAGDLGFDPLNFKSKYADQDDMQLRELKNGRLAMLGASGLLLQEAATHHALFDF